MDKPSNTNILSSVLPTSKTRSAGGGKKPDKSGVAGVNTPPIFTTRPDAIVLHQITDEQLDALEANNRDGQMDFFWCASGVAAGSLISTCKCLYSAFFLPQPIPLSVWDFLQVIMFFIAFTGAIIMLVIYKQRSKAGKNIVNMIRNRTKVQQ